MSVRVRGGGGGTDLRWRVGERLRVQMCETTSFCGFVFAILFKSPSLPP